MEQGIKFIITGDTTSLDNASKKAESALDALNRKIAQLQKEIGDNIQISQGYEKAISDLSNELKKGTISQDQYAKSLSRLKRDERETGIETNNLRKQLSQLQRDQKSLAGSTGGAVKGFNNMNKSAANAVPSLTSFSQVIQDAPYGIRGVANNITQLTSQFGYLSKNAGGTKAALKAMLGTLAGPAGILLAVSAVTSILVTYGDEIFNAIGSTDKLAEATKEYIKEARSEQTQLQALVGLAKDETKSKEVREGAIQKLNEKYKDYLGNLTLETINSDKAKLSVDALSASLIRQAQIRGISKLIEEKSLELAEQEIDAKKKGQKEAQKIITSNKASTKSYEEQREAFNTFGSDYKKTLDSIRKEGGKKIILGTIDEETKKIKSEINELVTFLQSKLSEEFEFEALFKIKSDKPLEAPVVLPKIETKKIIEVTNDAQDKLNSLGGGIITLPPVSLPDVIGIENTFTALDELRTKMENAQITADIFSSAVSSSFSALASQISESMATGNAVVDAFVGSIVQSLSQLLSQMIAQSITQAIVGNALASASGIAAQAQGVQIATQGALAFGPLGVALLPELLATTQLQISAALALAKVPKFATGGVVGGGSFTGDNIPIFVNSGERILTVQDQSFLTNFLRGNTAGTSNNGKQDPLVGQVILRGADLYVALKREEKRR